MSKALLAIPLFFLLLVIPAHAYVTIDINTTPGYATTGTRYIDCVNQSSDNGIYCYSLTETYSGGNYRTFLYKVNSTGQNLKSCQFEISPSGNNNYQFALINENLTYYNHGDSRCEYWNITDIANGNCALINQTTLCPKNAYNVPHLASSVTSQFDVAGGWIYGGVYLNAAVVDSTNLTSYYNATWNTSKDWGYGTQWMYGLTIPSETDNSSIYVYGLGQNTGSQRPNSPFYYYYNGQLSAQIDPPADMFGVCLGNHTCWSSIIETFNNTWIFMLDTSMNPVRFYRANFTSNTTYSSQCTWNGEPEGTMCVGGPNDGIYRVNYDNCNVTDYSCPSGDRCVNLTPQYNATYSLVENVVDCSKCYFLRQYYPSNNSWVTIKTNCWNALSCLNTVQWGVGFPYAVLWGSGLYHYNQTIPTGITATFPVYTAYCQKPDGTTDYIIDQYGNQETESIFVFNQTGINISAPAGGGGGCPINTTTECYNAACSPVSCYTGEDNIQALRNWTNAGLKTPFGADLIALMLSSVAAIAVFAKSEGKHIEVLMATFLLVAGAFSFIGFLTQWFLVLEAGLIFVMIFWKVKGG